MEEYNDVAGSAASDEIATKILKEYGGDFQEFMLSFNKEINNRLTRLSEFEKFIIHLKVSLTVMQHEMTRIFVSLEEQDVIILLKTMKEQILEDLPRYRSNATKWLKNNT